MLGHLTWCGQNTSISIEVDRRRMMTGYFDKYNVDAAVFQEDYEEYKNNKLICEKCVKEFLTPEEDYEEDYEEKKGGGKMNTKLTRTIKRIEKFTGEKVTDHRYTEGWNTVEYNNHILEEVSGMTEAQEKRYEKFIKMSMDYDHSWQFIEFKNGDVIVEEKYPDTMESFRHIKYIIKPNGKMIMADDSNDTGEQNESGTKKK